MNYKFKMKLRGGGGICRYFTLVFHNVPMIIFEFIFMRDNGKQYDAIVTNRAGVKRIETQTVNIVKQSANKLSTRGPNGCCPNQWLNFKLNDNKWIEEIGQRLEKLRTKYPDITYMIDTGNVIFDTHVKWNAPGMNKNDWQSLI